VTCTTGRASAGEAGSSKMASNAGSTSNRFIKGPFEAGV
jgi:hypothetical protein